MGGGTFTASSFRDYVTTKYGSSTASTMTADLSLSSNISHQDAFKQYNVHELMNPKKVIRECLNTTEHPNTVPVIFALDVTGSMGDAATEVAKHIGKIMTKLYEEIPDVEFMIMGLGDLYCDRGPIQIGQFESDIRVTEWLDRVWFEFGGGGNSYESYSAAWYMGLNHTKLDCWDQGRKGIIITIGDEQLNPYLPKNNLVYVTGDTLQEDVDTSALYLQAKEKFDIYHIQVNHRGWVDEDIPKTWSILGDNYKESNLNDIDDTVIGIVKSANGVINSQGAEISW